MRNLLVLGIVAIVMAIGVPAMAATEEPTAFYALSKVAEQDVTAMTAMSDQQLATVEGGAKGGTSALNSLIGVVHRKGGTSVLKQNLAVVTQNNYLIQINTAYGDNNVQINSATQTNDATIIQVNQ